MQIIPKGIKRSDFYAVPNILGYLRILLIPVFMYLYFTAQCPRDYYIAAAVVLVSTVSDCLDGFLARTLHQVTELGILLDPVADKLTHLALAICLVSRYPLMWVVLGIMFVKEGFMFIMGLVKLQSGKKLTGAKWFGKVSTACVYFIMFALFVWVDIPLNVANILIYAGAALLLFAFGMYIPVFKKM